MEKVNVLVVGSGGREHALAWKLEKSPGIGSLFVAPGNAGTSNFNVPIASESLEHLADFAAKNQCLTIVGPEAPLCLGIVDLFRSRGLRIFGPTKVQAELESSKSHAKKMMQKCGIRTARYEVFHEYERALDFASTFNGDLVVKADGLAKGKGVFVCSGNEQAKRVLRALLVENSLGEAGKRVVVEEKLEGYEVSLMALCDGKTGVAFGTATDHKRAFNGNSGPNTGGMGACSPAITFDKEQESAAIQDIVKPIVAETGFKGFLYAGLLISKEGTYVLEFNVRLGDPETQAIVPRMDFDLLDVISTAESSGLRLDDLSLNWTRASTCCVVMCSEGYPGDTKIGKTIFGLAEIGKKSIVFHSGTKMDRARVITNGGRVLSVVGLAEDLLSASEAAYSTVAGISWEGEHHRTDIGIRSYSNPVQSTREEPGAIAK